MNGHMKPNVTYKSVETIQPVDDGEHVLFDETPIFDSNSPVYIPETIADDNK